MTPRLIAWLIAAATAAYLILAGARAWVLVASGDPIPTFLGVSVIVIPVVGAWLLWRELKFGMATQRLGASLSKQGGLPVDDLPRTASGRVQREAADARFATARAEVEEDPDDWRRWYRLAIAYDDARDRKRARSAMRRAISLEKSATRDE